jgi:hypothetical protein
MGDIQSRPSDPRARDLDPDPDGDTVRLPAVPLMRPYRNDRPQRHVHTPRPRCGTGLVL